MSDAAEWDRRYESAERLFVAEPDEDLVALVSDLPAGRAVDLGCGEGRNALWLARQGWRVTAVDFSQVALSRLQELSARVGVDVDVVNADIAEYLARGQRFDLVVLANMHPAPQLRTRLFQGAGDMVESGGHLLVVGHHLESLGKVGPPDPERLYTEDVLSGAFPGLDVLRLTRREHGHGDTGALGVDLVAWATRRS